VDGITAANQLGLTHAVPSRVTVHTDARIRPIRLGNMTINFKPTAPSRLYWAGRPAMRFVQALRWLRDMLPSGKDSFLRRLKNVLNDPAHGPTIRNDLQKGLHTLPQRSHRRLALLGGPRLPVLSSRRPASSIMRTLLALRSIGTIRQAHGQTSVEIATNVDRR
jgi:hypothetical protein